MSARETIRAAILTLCTTVNSIAQDKHIGDFIAHSSKTFLSGFTQKTTQSNYTHCGIVDRDERGWVVWEATGKGRSTVRSTPFDKWVSQGKRHRFTVKRAKDKSKITEMMEYCRNMRGMPYDHKLDYSTDEPYCSEFLAKAYAHAYGQMLGFLEPIEPMIAPHRHKGKYSRYIKQKFKNPSKKFVVTPKSIFLDEKLETIYTNY